MDNREIALEQQGGNAEASLQAIEEQELCLDYSTPVGQGFFWSGVVRGHQDCGRAVYVRDGLGNRQNLETDRKRSRVRL